MSNQIIEESWTCCDEQVYDRPGIFKHLKDVHGLTSPIRSIKALVMAVDGVDYSLNTYQHTIGDLTLHQSIKTTEEPQP